MISLKYETRYLGRWSTLEDVIDQVCHVGNIYAAAAVGVGHEDIGFRRRSTSKQVIDDEVNVLNIDGGGVVRVPATNGKQSPAGIHKAVTVVLIIASLI